MRRALTIFVVMLALLGPCAAARAQTLPGPSASDMPTVFVHASNDHMLMYVYETFRQTDDARAVIDGLTWMDVEEATDYMVTVEDEQEYLWREAYKVGAEQMKAFYVEERYGESSAWLVIARRGANIAVVAAITRNPRTLDEQVVWDFVRDVVEDGQATPPVGYREDSEGWDGDWNVEWY